MTQNVRVATWIPEGALDGNKVVMTVSSVAAGQAASTRMSTPAAATGAANSVTGRDIHIGPVAPTNPVDGDSWFDLSDPQHPDIKIWNAAIRDWVLSGRTLPVAQSTGQALVSGAAPGFDWTAGDVDGSRY